MDQKKPMSFLDLLEHMKSSLGIARKTAGTIEERQKSLTEREASKDDEKPDELKADEVKPADSEPDR